MARETRMNAGSAEEMRVYAPGSGGDRVYAPSSGSLAYRQDYAFRSARLAPAPAARPEQRPEVGKKPSESKKQRVSLLQMARQNRFFPKLIAVCCIVAVAAVAAFAVVRFVNIAKLQNEINALNSTIQETERTIENLSFNAQPVINATEFAETVGLVPARP